MKKIFLIAFFFLSQIVHSNEVLITLATINNVPISNRDLSDEVLVLEVLNKNQEVNKNLLKEIAFKNLINDTIMSIEIKKKILKKIRLQQEWNSLIARIYYKKINININEIEKKIKDLGYKDFNDSKTIELKEKMISDERNKKFNMYSKKHMNKIKKEQFVKIFK